MKITIDLNEFTYFRPKKNEQNRRRGEKRAIHSAMHIYNSNTRKICTSHTAQWNVRIKIPATHSCSGPADCVALLVAVIILTAGSSARHTLAALSLRAMWCQCTAAAHQPVEVGSINSVIFFFLSTYPSLDVVCMLFRFNFRRLCRYVRAFETRIMSIDLMKWRWARARIINNVK